MPDKAGQEPQARANINLRVTEEERWAFKAWCVAHRMSQVEAFREAFALLQRRRQEKERDDERG